MDRNKLLKMTAILAAIVVIAGAVSRIATRDSMSLSDYAQLHGSSAAPSGSQTDSSEAAPSSSDKGNNDPESFEGGSSPAQNEGSSTDGSPSQDSDGLPNPSSEPDADAASQLIGASLNGVSQLEQRTLLEEGFYYEPVSDNLRRYMTGISFPALDEEGDSQPEITFDELRYVHILHYGFDGEPREGELICNQLIAQDLAEIFLELYRNEYQLEKVLLIDEYEGDDTASMEDNNTSCFNYRPVEGTKRLSKHAYGLAVDVNPLYNPYITYAEDGTEEVSPVSAVPYADRDARFPYKIDEADLCYKLFLQHGFTWGGNWNSVKDYQHFQKAK